MVAVAGGVKGQKQCERTGNKGDNHIKVQKCAYGGWSSGGGGVVLVPIMGRNMR
jgi:hypothetical protein